MWRCVPVMVANAEGEADAAHLAVQATRVVVVTGVVVALYEYARRVS